MGKRHLRWSSCLELCETRQNVDVYCVFGVGGFTSEKCVQQKPVCLKWRVAPFVWWRKTPPSAVSTAVWLRIGLDWIGWSNVPRGSVKRSTWVLVFEVWLHSYAFVPCHPCLMCSCSWCSGFFSLAHFIEQERACHSQLLVNYLLSSYVHSYCQSIHYVVRIVSMSLHSLFYPDPGTVATAFIAIHSDSWECFSFFFFGSATSEWMTRTCLS